MLLRSSCKFSPLSRQGSVQSCVPVDHVEYRFPCRLVLAKAQRREIEPAYYYDLYDSLSELSRENCISLPKSDTLVLVESIKNRDEAIKTLELFKTVIANRDGTVVNDWSTRKLYYMNLVKRLRVLSLYEIIYDLLRGMEEYQIPPTFGHDVIHELAKTKVHSSVLCKVLEIIQSKVEPSSKGLREAYYALLSVLRVRKESTTAMRIYSEGKLLGLDLGPTWAEWIERLKVAPEKVAVGAGRQ